MEENKLNVNTLSILVPIALIGVVLMFFVPLPTFLLDALQALNITISITIFLLSMYTKEALDFSIFPSLLLATTLFRLALNMASTKLILIQGPAFNGHLIKAFGDFIVGGNYVIGVVIFLILVIIQFIVITKGAERVAEVGARFTLDAMPGKQMSIDADYNAGLITEEEAKTRRKKVSMEADFYGAMDGASKFVKGDAIAGIIIVIINIVGGLIIGVMRGEAVQEAAATYIILTIGDGLSAQIPALLISIATGMIVTRSASTSNFGTDLINQFFQEPKILYIVSVALIVIGIIPGMPKLAFFTISIVFGILGYIMNKNIKDVQEKAEQKEENATKAASQESKADPKEEVKELLIIEQMELEIGYSLIPLVDSQKGGDLLERITMIRKQIAIEMGIIVPPIRIRDNMQLNPNEYVIKIRGSEVTRGELMIGSYLAMDPGGVQEQVSGIPTVEPAFGLPAVWIGEEQRERAELVGYTVVDPTSVLATHLTETIKKFAPEILGREIVKELIENIKKDYAVIVEEVFPKKLDLGDIQTVLQNLLNEGISIRNLPLILEVIADASKINKNPEVLAEYVRSGLSRQICNSLQGSDKKIRVFTVHPEMELILKQHMQDSDFGFYIVLPPDINMKFIYNVNEAAKKSRNFGHQPIMLVTPEIRKAVRRILEKDLRMVTVLSYNEVVPEAELEAIGMVGVE
jgi:flagellar biosynthesis protein FlhA